VPVRNDIAMLVCPAMEPFLDDKLQGPSEQSSNMVFASTHQQQPTTLAFPNQQSIISIKNTARSFLELQ
jgi:hypothetical protein